MHQNVVPLEGVCEYFLKSVRKDRFRNVWVGGRVWINKCPAPVEHLYSSPIRVEAVSLNPLPATYSGQTITVLDVLLHINVKARGQKLVL